MWFKLSSTPFDPGEGYASCVLDNCLYVSGLNLRKSYFLRYNPDTNSWEERCHMPDRRRYHEMIVVDNRVTENMHILILFFLKASFELCSSILVMCSNRTYSLKPCDEIMMMIYI